MLADATNSAEKYMQAKKFYNFTDYEFVWKFDGIPYTFPAKSTMFMEDFKVDHFASHLVDEELNRLNTPTNSPRRADLLAQCFPSDEVVPVAVALDIEEKKKAVRSKKKEEVEFEDLQDK